MNIMLATVKCTELITRSPCGRERSPYIINPAGVYSNRARRVVAYTTAVNMPTSLNSTIDAVLKSARTQTKHQTHRPVYTCAPG